MTRPLRIALTWLAALALLTGCGGSRANLVAPMFEDDVAAIAAALTPADAASAHDHLDLRFAVDVWLAGRCPYLVVYDTTGQRLDQSIFADAASLASSGLGLGAPAPEVVAMSEQQLDPVEFDLDGDIETITGDEATAIAEAVERCPRLAFEESVDAASITDRWFAEVVAPLIGSDAMRDRELAAVRCLHDREPAWLAPGAQRLAEVFVSVDEHLAAAGSDNFDEIAAAVDRNVGAALADCAGDYYERVQRELRASRERFLAGQVDLIESFAAGLAERSLSP